MAGDDETFVVADGTSVPGVNLPDLLAKHHLEALLLQRVSSFAWATCGAASYINTAATTGDASLLITPSGRYVLTNNIEAPRLEQELRELSHGVIP